MSKRRPLGAVFFDIDDTLFSTTAFSERARNNAVSAMCGAGLRKDPGEVKGLLDDIVLELSSNSNRHYDALIARLGPEAYRPVNPAVIVAAGVVAYHDTKMRELKPFPDVVEVLRGLHGLKGLRLGVISEGRSIKQAEKMVRLGLLEFFDPLAVFITQADQENDPPSNYSPVPPGLSKAHAEMYTWINAALDVPARCCMRVGDNPRNDIDPAQAAGWITVHSRRPGSKYGRLTPREKPDYVIQDLFDLRRVLERDFDPGAV